MNTFSRLMFLFTMIIAASTPTVSAQDKKPLVQRMLPVRCLAFSPDGGQLASGHRDYDDTGGVVVWDIKRRRPRFEYQETAKVLSVAFSPRGDILAISTPAKEAVLLDAANGSVRGELKGHKDKVRCLAFSPDGKQLATGSNDRTIKLWDLSTREVELTFSDHQNVAQGVAISPDGKWLASAGGEENVARLWNLDSPTESPLIFVTSGYSAQVAFSPDSRWLALPNWGGGMPIVDIASGKETLKITNVGGQNWACFSPDGKWLAVASNGPQITIIPAQITPNADQRHEVSRLIDQFQQDDIKLRDAAGERLIALGSIAIEQLRENLASPMPEVRVRCRRLLEKMHDGDFAMKLSGHKADLECVAFSPDGKLLASGDWKGGIKLWNVADWKEAAPLVVEKDSDK